MTDTNTDARREWVSAGCPGIKQPAPIYQRDHNGRPVFRYTSAAATDIRATFARVRRQLAREGAQ